MSVGENCPNCGHALGLCETISTQTKEAQERHLVCPAAGCGFQSENLIAVDEPAPQSA